MNVRSLSALLLFAVLCVVGRIDPASAETRSFVVDSYDGILRARGGAPFLLVLWSVDCPPCLKELTVLSSELTRHPDLRLVLVATDEPALRSRVDQILEQKGLGAVESWIFGEESSNRLRQRIDPAWYGELPRSYFFDRQHQRTAVSGGLTAEHLDTWLKSLAPR